MHQYSLFCPDWKWRPPDKTFTTLMKEKSQEGQVFPEHSCVMLIKMLIPVRERAGN